MKPKLLIADDLKLNRIMLAELFASDYEIFEAKDGKSTFNILDNTKIDIILLDLIMPGMSGQEVLQTIKSNPRFADIPVIIITASKQEVDQIQLFQLGASDYITKPFVPEIVIQRVNNVVLAKKRFHEVLSERNRLKEKAELDSLTGIYNKGTTENQINDILTNEKDSLHALMLFDVDNFKSVNDNLGHMAGDKALRFVADLLSSAFSREDIVGRIGGDEFATLMRNIPSREFAIDKAQEIIRLVRYKQTLLPPNHISLSIGIAFSEYESNEFVTLYEQSDQALYNAKTSGKGCSRVYGDNYCISNAKEQKFIIFTKVPISKQRLESLFGKNYNITIITTLDELLKECETEKTENTIVVVDVHSEQDNGAAIWNSLIINNVINTFPSIAVYSESDMKQLKLALEAGATDVVSIPIEEASMLRKVERILKP